MIYRVAVGPCGPESEPAYSGLKPQTWLVAHQCVEPKPLAIFWILDFGFWIQSRQLDSKARQVSAFPECMKIDCQRTVLLKPWHGGSPAPIPLPVVISIE